MRLKNFHGYILSLEKPTVTISSKPYPSLLEGERLSLTCQANEATKEIRWAKDDVSVIDGLAFNTLGTSVLLLLKTS